LLSTIYLEFGRLYRKARDPESAVHALREAIRADPSHAAPYPLLAELFIEMDKHAAARETLEKALEVSPGMAEALRLLEWLDEQE
jgi:Tfp pilus assembly protein PilF